MDHTQEITPGIIALLPLFFVGWSDSILSPSEMKMIHNKIDSSSFLTDDEKAYLIHYTNPANIPNEQLFKRWVEALKEHGNDIDEIAKLSLAELGKAMANSVDERRAFNGPEYEAIKDIERALGLNSHSSVKILTHKLNAKETNDNTESSFDPIELRKVLYGEKQKVIDRVFALIKDPFFSYIQNPNKENLRAKTLERVKALGRQGLGAYAFPKLYGGGGREGDHITVFESLAFGDLSLLVKFGVQFGLFGGTVYKLGTERHHRRYLDNLGKADLLGCFAMTETGHGSNVRGLETTAVYDHASRSITINSPNREAGKEYIGNALHSSMAAVFAQLYVEGKNHGVHAILVEMRDSNGNLMKGVEVDDCGYKMGLNGVDNGRIWFNDVNVPVENLLDRYGAIGSDGQYVSSIQNPNKRFFTMLGALVVGRICVGLAGINASKSALTIAIQYANKRRQFASKEDHPETIIMDYPSHQRRLLPKLSKTYGYYIALSQLAEEYNDANDEEMRKIETKAAGLKSMATWHATKTIQECREACGGKGYLSENRLDALKADSDIFTTFEGDNTVLMQLVAKGLLTEFKQSFHDEGFMAVIRYLGDRVSNTMIGYNPIYTRNTSVDHLMDRDFHRHAFRYREKKLLISLSQRMQDYLKKRINPFEAFLKCQNHMIELSKAYVERLVLKAFESKIQGLEPSKEREALDKMCSLYALSVIEENKGWYLEADYIEGVKTKAIRRMVSKLCSEMSSDSSAYVEAFGIPKVLLGAQILK